MNPFRTKEFKKLKKKWYALLKKKGFQDVETERGGTDLLKAWDSLRFQINYTPDQFQARQLYYEMAAHFLWDHRFKADVEKAVWRLHVDGVSDHKITELLNLKRWRVQKIIHELRTLMLKKAKEG